MFPKRRISLGKHVSLLEVRSRVQGTPAWMIAIGARVDRVRRRECGSRAFRLVGGKWWPGRPALLNPLALPVVLLEPANSQTHLPAFESHTDRYGRGR